MGHTPYDYRIEDGKAIVDEEQAIKVKEFFNAYISGLALKEAAEKVGLKICHRSAGMMLRNKRYLGDDYYPQLSTRKSLIRQKKGGWKRLRHLEGFVKW